MRKKIMRTLSLTMAAAVTAGMLGIGSARQVSAEETPSFDVLTVRWTDSWPTDFLESGFMKSVEEETGVDISWQVYFAGDWSEQKALLLASGTLPDAFLGSISLTANDIAQNRDYFVDLTDLINEENMPNLTRVFEENPGLKAVCTNRDGRIYSLPKKLPLRPQVCGDSMYINKEWLDHLGLEVPKTYQELADVLKAFAAEDADGDGDSANEIGITNHRSEQLLSGDLRQILSPFGTMVSRDGNYMGLNGEGTPVFVPAQENYKEAVIWMHDLWEAGAVDLEYFTQEQSAKDAKLQQSGGSQIGLAFGWTADAQVSGNAGQFQLLEAVEGYDGNHYVEAATDYLDIGDRELVITTECEDPAALLKWADAFYTDLASLQTFYGSIPDQVAENGDGTYEVLTPEDGSSLDLSAWSNSLRDFGPKYMNPDFYGKVSIPADQGDGVKLAEDEVNGKYVQAGRNTGFPMIQYTEDELSRIISIGIDIYKYVEAQYAHWVTDGGIEEEWDDYMERLNLMGLEELVEIQTEAYNAYLESMK